MMKVGDDMEGDLNDPEMMIVNATAAAEAVTKTIVASEQYLVNEYCSTLNSGKLNEHMYTQNSPCSILPGNNSYEMMNKMVAYGQHLTNMLSSQLGEDSMLSSVTYTGSRLSEDLSAITGSCEILNVLRNGPCMVSVGPFAPTPPPPPTSPLPPGRATTATWSTWAPLSPTSPPPPQPMPPKSSSASTGAATAS